ncbi:unnamed protein product, partial [marine sediment metagenome]
MRFARCRARCERLLTRSLPKAVELLKERPATPNALREFKKVTPTPQAHQHVTLAHEFDVTVLLFGQSHDHFFVFRTVFGC